MKYSLADLLDNFKLKAHRENFRSVIKTIESGVQFRGTNLWVLVFAILIASLGLNVNSPAVIIGAMLVSPLMGPIMGMGLAMGINDLQLLRKSLTNYAFAAGVSLATSTLFFLASPINEAHSELLARTTPNVYDVLIAFVGGLAGILATASKLKGNVLPGVAIATALMPPLCTAGYGIATGQGRFFAGAFYLFIINTVFIALATLVTVRFMRFPYREQPDPDRALKVRRIIWLVTLLTILPSVYLGYQIVDDTRFKNRAERFIEFETAIPGDFLLKKSIDSRERSIVLTFGGKPITSAQIADMRRKLAAYGIETARLEVKQGFEVSDEKATSAAQARIADRALAAQILGELQAQGFTLENASIAPAILVSPDKADVENWVVSIETRERLPAPVKQRIADWLKVRLKAEHISVQILP
ncbi:TIGR00341 family protein [Turneriella parva]|uniref:TIGR00341 family protein n=1 Tax=Turneriella parva (strain ATCC BAA-1111 / DSM 21527 / NCTC 11395 / H) TaxID=869212 RepID=I4BAV8_TURPD|nr:TIGR00341 family protein [Turneriella parva]AFM14415.1 protein of unknown function DUF389 [Turneriella parva DSM 21527]